MAVKKIKTGVTGLDEILKGGLRERSSILVSGGPGTGKSILAMHFLVEGAKNKEPGLCILYDGKEDFLDFADSLNLPVRAYEKAGLIHLVEQPLAFQRVASLEAPLAVMRKRKIKRVVLDSLTLFAYAHIAREQEYRKGIVSFLSHMKDVTLLATAENEHSTIEGVSFRPEDFLFDGIIFLAKERQEASFERVIHVSKMRGQDHLLNLYPFFIGKGGIKVYPDQLPFSLFQKNTVKKSRNN